jgi:hypothetical protein
MRNIVSHGLLFLTAWTLAAAGNKPIALHPENPHYFLWRGKPTVLITSAEHYGAVLNLDFDFTTYLKELESRKLNNTRIFSGAYVEPPGAFDIANNTLAPAPGRFICPWPWNTMPAYPKKFDLTKWNEDYFKRLRDFVSEAGQRGVVVEMNLFCPMYDEAQWKLSPQNPANHIPLHEPIVFGHIERTNVYRLDQNNGLLAVQVQLTRKIVTELNAFDNVYYEICNEPYFGGVTIEWQHHIAKTIVDTEKSLPNTHLISQNIANGSQKITKPTLPSPSSISITPRRPRP